MTRAGQMAAILLLTDAGCSSGGSPSTATNVASVADLGTSITAAFCAWQFRCCTAIEITVLEGNGYRTETACAASGVSIAVRDQLALAGDAVSNGLMVIDPAVASACVNAYAQAPCAAPSSGPPAQPDVGAIVTACPGLFVGQIPVGLRCDMTAECTSGAHCVSSTALGGGAPDGGLMTPPTPTTNAVFGVCEPYRVLGQSCNDSSECDPAAGLTCRSLDRTCARPAGADERCAAAATFPFSEPTIACAAGLFCDPNALVCRHLPVANEPCAPSGIAALNVPCNPDPSLALSCVGTSLGGLGICMGPAKAGDACGGQALPTCASGLACIATQPDGIGTCGAAPGVGAPCASGGICAGSAACDATTFLCTTPGATAIGLPCTSNPDCVSMSCEASRLAALAGICLQPRQMPACTGNGTTPGIGVFGPTPDGGGGGVEGGAPPAADAGAPLEAGVGGAE